MPINAGDSEAEVKATIDAIIDGAGLDSADNTDTTAATNLLNQVAAIYSQPGVSNGMAGDAARAAINNLENYALYVPEARSLFARQSPAPDFTWKRYYDDLVRGLIADGTWAKIDRLQIYGSYAAQPARQNVRADAFNMTINGSPVFTAEQGYAGDGVAAYLSSGYAPASSAGSVATQNSTHAFVWSNTESAAPSTYAETGNSKVSLTLRSSGGLIGVRMHVASTVTEPVTSSLGMWGAVRSASNQHLIYHDGLLFATESSTSSAPAADETYDLARNVSGVLTTPSARQLFAVCYGSGLTAAEVAMINGRVQAFKNKVPASDLLTVTPGGQLMTLNGTYMTA